MYYILFLPWLMLTWCWLENESVIMLARPLTLYTYLELSVGRAVRTRGLGATRGTSILATEPPAPDFGSNNSKNFSFSPSKGFEILLAPPPPPEFLDFPTALSLMCLYFGRRARSGRNIRWLRKDEKRKPPLCNNNRCNIIQP